MGLQQQQAQQLRLIICNPLQTTRLRWWRETRPVRAMKRR